MKRPHLILATDKSFKTHLRFPILKYLKNKTLIPAEYQYK